MNKRLALVSCTPKSFRYRHKVNYVSFSFYTNFYNYIPLGTIKKRLKIEKTRHKILSFFFKSRRLELTRSILKAIISIKWFFKNLKIYKFFNVVEKKKKIAAWPVYSYFNISGVSYEILSTNNINFFLKLNSLPSCYPKLLEKTKKNSPVIVNLNSEDKIRPDTNLRVFNLVKLTRSTLAILRVLNFYKPLHYQSYSGYFYCQWSRTMTMDKVLFLNFRRFKFFPSLQNMNNYLYTTTSLGIFSKFLNKGKSFIKNKLVYLVLAGFFRKILLYLDIISLWLFVKRTPLYFREILSTINSPVIVNYKHPFDNSIVDEFKLNKEFYFSFFVFLNSKPYGYLKPKKKGRIKRKITKKLIKLNNVTD